MEIIRFETTDLSSRHIARSFRADIEDTIKKDKKVIVDFGGVLSVSASFGDELFGVLALEFGLESFREKINIVNASPSVIRSIAETIDVRINPAR